MLWVLRVLKLQRRVLEATVMKRTHELAERNIALMQAQAQLKAQPSRRALDRDPPSKGESGCDGAARMVPAGRGF